MKKLHAQHNRRTCQHLLATEEFNDWVITTAFYSCLHFVQHEIFPLSEGGKDFPNFNAYYSKLKKGKKRFSKHHATINLVKDHLPKVSARYRWLHDACMNARYSNYNVKGNKAQKAFDHLTVLEGEMKK